MGLKVDIKKHLLTAYRKRIDSPHVVEVPDQKAGWVHASSKLRVACAARTNHRQIDDAQCYTTRQMRRIPVRQGARGLVDFASSYDEQWSPVICLPGAHFESFSAACDQAGPRLLNNDGFHPHIVGCIPIGSSHG